MLAQDFSISPQSRRTRSILIRPLLLPSELFNLLKQLPRFCCLSPVYGSYGKTGLDKYNIADPRIRDKGGSDIPPVSHRIGDGLIAVKLNYCRRYRKTHNFGKS
jgi:hypothetical protein